MAFQAPVAGGRSPWRPTAWPGSGRRGAAKVPGQGPGPLGRPRLPRLKRLRHGAWDTRRAPRVTGCQPLPLRTCWAESSGNPGLGTWEKPCDASSDRPRPDRRAASETPRPGGERSQTRFEEGATVRQRLARIETERIFGLETLSAANEAPLCSLSAKGRNPACILE